MRPTFLLFLLLAMIFTLQSVRADDGDDLLNEAAAEAQIKELPKTPDFVPQKFVPPNPLDPKGRWSVIFPAFVMHGILPANGANQNMPRKIDSNGRFVITPGIGGEWEGSKSLDLIAAFIKDCYDDYAGTIQAGQYFRLSKSTRIGYTLGLYIRQTPIACYTQQSTSQSNPPGNGHSGGGLFGGIGSQPQTNTLTTTTCLFEDNLPIRYTFKIADQYIDVIPTPFLTFSTRLYDGPVQILFKFITNYYLTEFGLALAF